MSGGNNLPRRKYEPLFPTAIEKVPSNTQRPPANSSRHRWNFGDIVHGEQRANIHKSTESVTLVTSTGSRKLRAPNPDQAKKRSRALRVIAETTCTRPSSRNFRSTTSLTLKMEGTTLKGIVIANSITTQARSAMP